MSKSKIITFGGPKATEYKGNGSKIDQYKNNNFPTSPANESKFSCASSNQSFHPKGNESNSSGCISYNSMNTSHMQVTHIDSGHGKADS